MTANFPTINQSTTLYHNDSRIVYKGNWNHNEVFIGVNGETITYSSTTDIEANVGMNAYKAPAGVFSYYGFKLPERGRYSICVDCSFVAPHVVTINAQDPNYSPSDPPVVMHTTPIQASDQHIMILSNLQDMAPDGTFPPSRLTISKVELVFPSGITVSSTTSSSLSSSSTTQGTPTTTTTSSASTPAKQVPVGAIVGGVLGSLILLALIIGFIYYKLIRGKNQRIVHRPALIGTVPAPPRAPAPINYLITPFAPPKMPSPLAEDAPYPYMRSKSSRRPGHQRSESDDPFAYQPRNVTTLPRSKAALPAHSGPLRINTKTGR
ncbi:hypothetical protein CVT24_011236 [Panaeolus cyanescens]|uniref:Uncharacterized protein n=1 Tax=Panaeolus cyanescens TaxID=181874 RepID=A0A409YGJ3_9AGAR|nr:hypothetical protein CVT24_011236 [Panaeolus cyanescens]